MKRFTSMIVAVLLCTALFLQGCAPIKLVAKSLLADQRPNFLVIISDDQRADTMQYMPQTHKWIFDQGVTFSRAYITTPLCCPSRVSIFTGLYAHNTGVLNNDDKNTNRTLFEVLHENGYYTGLVGKYLNSWKGEARPEFDYWVSYFKGESRYDNPTLEVNGQWKKHIGYITDILGTYSLDFLDHASNQNKPWILLYAPIAPHDPTTPFAGDLDQYTDLEPWRPPSFNIVDSGKPAWLQDEPALTSEQITALDIFRRNQILTLLPLDRAIGILMKEVERKGELDNTVVIYISDNGKMWGEHRLMSKNTIYEEAVHVPFGLRYPTLVKNPYTENHLVGNIDIAPTIFELAKVQAPSPCDGLSLVGLLGGKAKWRGGLLTEGWPGRGIYASWETDQYVYSETQDDKAELYDLKNDPYEMVNLVDLPQYQSIVAEMKAQLAEARAQGVNLPKP